MVSRKVSLDGGRATQRRSAGLPASTETVELFFNSGIVYHEVPLPDPLPDVIAGFMVVQGEGTAGHQVRAAGAGENPDVEIGSRTPEVPAPWTVRDLRVVSSRMTSREENPTGAPLRGRPPSP